MQNLWPLLFLLACPLMMIFMMRGMGGGGHPGQVTPPCGDAREDRDDARDRRIADLEREIAALRKNEPAADDAVGQDTADRDRSPR